MKAATILEHLFRDNNTEQGGVFTVDYITGEMRAYLPCEFASDEEEIDMIYDPHDFSHMEVGKDEKPRTFVYMYNDSFYGCDDEVYAIMGVGDGNVTTSIIYFYEVE